MLKNSLKAGFASICNFLLFTGGVVIDILETVFSVVLRFIAKILKAVFGLIGKWFSKELKQPLYEAWCYFLTPIAHAFGTIAHTSIQLKKARKLGFKHTVQVCYHSLIKSMGGLVGVLKFAFNYVAPAVCIAFLMSLINYASTLQYTISVEYNGSNLGIISNEADYNQAQALVQDKITYADGDKAVLGTPKFYVRMMQEDDAPIDTDNLSELMINTAEVQVVDAYGLYINDSLIGVYNQEEMEKVRTALENRLAENYGQGISTVDFVDKIELNQGRYLGSNLSEADDIVEYICGVKTVEAYYVVEKGDSINSLAEKLGTSADSLKKSNPFMTGGIHAGDMVVYSFEEPNLSVQTTRYETYDRVIPTAIQYTYDNKAEIYTEVLVQRGSSGFENVTACITEINGKETDRVITRRYVIEEMVPMIIQTGTLPNETLGGDTHVIDLLGTFIWPVGWDGGYSYVSSLYGYRKWDKSNHKGMDIAAKRGTDIYAAASGTVVFAGTYSTYGKLVIIDHGNGYETYYGHQSSIEVEKGDKVEKGDLIGHVGMTGSASGNHLHFELRYNDERIDPILGLGGVGSHEVRNY